MSKNKLTKFAEMAELPNVFQPELSEVLSCDYRRKGAWHEYFGNNHPIVLEVGCGKGEYSVGLAERFPDKNFIGLDIKGARMWTGATLAVQKNITNVAFLRSRAEFLSSLFAENEIAEIWITFPDPQPGKAKKRLTGSRFLKLYRSFLLPDGIVHLKTDSGYLYTYTLWLVKENNLSIEVETDNLYESGLASDILSIRTFYEQQWLTRGKAIKYLKFHLPKEGEIAEPKEEPERDDYHSERRFMRT